MKRQTNIQTEAKRQNGKGIQNAFTVVLSKINSTLPMEVSSGGSNTLLVQNIGKDPPGRSLGPEAAYCQSPDKRPVSLKSNKPLFITEFQLFKQIQHSNFINI